MRSFIEELVDKKQLATAPYNAGSMLKSSAHFQPLLDIQRKRLCGGISVIAEGQFHKLEFAVHHRDQYSPGLQEALMEDIKTNGSSLPYKQDDPNAFDDVFFYDPLFNAFDHAFVFDPTGASGPSAASSSWSTFDLADSLPYQPKVGAVVLGPIGWRSSAPVASSSTDAAPR